MLKLRRAFQIAGVVIWAYLVTAPSSGCSSQRSKPQEPITANQQATRKIANTCSLLSEEEIAKIVGNPVSKGRIEASTDVCKWDTDEPGNVDVLLIAREAGSIREQVLCDDLRNKTDGERIAGLGDVAAWKFSREGSLFNSGDLEVCGAKGYLSLTLQGKRDESNLKGAATMLAQKVWERL